MCELLLFLYQGRLVQSDDSQSQGLSAHACQTAALLRLLQCVRSCALGEDEKFLDL